jgi:hypothetical protein
MSPGGALNHLCITDSDDPVFPAQEKNQEHIREDSFASLNKGSYQSFHATEHQIKVSLLSQQSKFGTPIYLITR